MGQMRIDLLKELGLARTDHPYPLIVRQQHSYLPPSLSGELSKHGAAFECLLSGIGSGGKYA